MTRRLTLLTAAVLLACSGLATQAKSTVNTVESGTLRDLSGANIGQVSLERQGDWAHLHVTDAGKAAGKALELLVSTSARELKVGDHAGPGQNAMRAGLIERAEVRYRLLASVRPGSLRSVWVWCHSVRLPSARARLLSSLH
jgi:hypothetical protein